MVMKRVDLNEKQLMLMKYIVIMMDDSFIMVKAVNSTSEDDEVFLVT